jgi:hypothetical protein
MEVLLMKRKWKSTKYYFVLLLFAHAAGAFEVGQEVEVLTSENIVIRGTFNRFEMSQKDEESGEVAIINSLFDGKEVSAPLDKVREVLPDPHTFFAVQPCEVKESYLMDSVLSTYKLLKLPVDIIAKSAYSYEPITADHYQYYYDFRWGTDAKSSEDPSPPPGQFISDLRLIVRSEEDLRLILEKYGVFQPSKEAFEHELRETWRGSRELSVIDLLPRFVANNIGKFEKSTYCHEGANCRKAVLSFFDPYTKHSTNVNPLMEKIETEGRELGPGEILSPGDIVSVWSSEEMYRTIDWELRRVGRDDRRGHKHSVVYIGGNYVFGKDGPSDLDPFGIRSFDDAFGNYRGLYFTFHRLEKK